MVKIVLGNRSPSGMNAPPSDMFGPKKPLSVPNTNVTEDIGSINRRLKLMEERYTNLRNKFQVTEQNMLSKNKSFFTDIKAINLELTEIRKEIGELKDRIVMLIRDMESFAKKENVDMLRKYIDLWNPIKFVTHEEVEEIIKEVIDRMRRGE